MARVMQVQPTEVVACPNCGDDRPGKWRGLCEGCGTVVCIWCARDFHEPGVHPTGKTLTWRDHDYWKAVDWKADH